MRYRLENRSAVGARTQPSPFALYQTKRQRAIGAGARLLSAIQGDLEQGLRHRLDAHLEHLESLFEIVEMADCAASLIEENKPPPSRETAATIPAFFVSSWFIAECHNYLTSQPDGHERLHLVTGVKVSPGGRTLERMVKVGLARQSAVDALADQHELQKALIQMDEWGHQLHGLFHSHPGSGAPATQPSPKDLKTHERFERGGYPLVGAIFVRDGVVRFFGNHPFTISVYGKGVEKLDEHVFTLTPRHLPHKTPPGER